jgi:hypothetical protein
MEAIIHIGTEKTGTTSLQEYLLLNESLLEKNDIYLSQSSGLPNNRSLVAYAMNYCSMDDFFCHRNIKSGSEKNRFDEEFLVNFHKEMKTLLNKAKIVIFSSEHFSSRLTSIEEIAKLKSLLAIYFDTFKVVCYLRPQFDLAVSHYSTALRIGEPRSVLEYIHQECQLDNYYYDYPTMINLWCCVFNEESLYLRSFDKKLLKNNSLYDDFFHTINILNFLDPNVSLPRNKNASLNGIGQRLLMHYNCLPHRIDLKNKGIAKADSVVKLLEELYSGPAPEVSNELKEEKFEIFKKSNLVLMNKYNIDGLNTLKKCKAHHPSKFNFSIKKIKLLLKILKLFIYLPLVQKKKYTKIFNTLIISILVS